MRVEHVPLVEPLEEAVQVDGLVEADHDAEASRDVTHGVLGMPEAAIVVTGH